MLRYLYAKEKLGSLLAEVKSNYQNLPNDIDNNNQFHNLHNFDNNKIRNEFEMEQENHMNEIYNANNSLLEDNELLKFYYHKEKWINKSSGSFNLAMTHRDRKIEDLIYNRI